MISNHLSIQTVLPQSFQEDRDFRANLDMLQKLGFQGLELNIEEFSRFDLADITSFLDDFGLDFTMFASGLTAKSHGLSLSSDNENTRNKSITACKQMIDFVAGSGAGVIIGYLKGPRVENVHKARDLFARSMEELGPYTAHKKVPLLIEATNRYESSVANTLEQAAALIKEQSGAKEQNNPFFRILPDTFHMNIEEADGLEALKKYASYYDSIHISDNNRFFPGLGAIKFEKVFAVLQDIGYSGAVAIEGNIKDGFVADVKESCSYLARLYGGDR